MKKIKTLLVICFALVAFAVLAGCEQTPACEHETGSWAANAQEHWQTCGKCNEQVNKGAHTFGEFEVIAEPAVGIEGTKVRKCTECNYIERETIPALVVNTGVAEGDFAVYAKIPADWETVNCYYFGEDKNPLDNTVSWPGAEMTLVNAEENIWGYVVPAGTGYVIFNNGTVQTADLLFALELNLYTLKEGSDGKFVADYGTYTPAEDQPELNKYPTEIAEEEKYTIYVQVPTEWTNVNAYWWGGKGSDGWPGTAMIQVEGNVWTIDLSEAATGLIFNNGTAQTGDITEMVGLHAGNAYIVNAELKDGKHTFVAANYADGAFTPVELEVEIPTDCYLRGASVGWDPVEAGLFVYNAETDTATLTIALVANDEFKVTVGADWGIQFNASNATLLEGAFEGTDNIKCLVAGTYVLTITDVTKDTRALTIVAAE